MSRPNASTSNRSVATDDRSDMDARQADLQVTNSKMSNQRALDSQQCTLVRSSCTRRRRHHPLVVSMQVTEEAGCTEQRPLQPQSCRGAATWWQRGNHLQSTLQKGIHLQKNMNFFIVKSCYITYVFSPCL